MNPRFKRAYHMQSALTGVSAAYFLALLSSNAKVCDSIFLFLSSLSFGILLPIYAATLAAHSICLDKDFTDEAIIEATDAKWVIKIADCSSRMVFAAFAFLVCHFSIFIGACMIVLSIIAFFVARRFIIQVQRIDSNQRRIKAMENDPGPF